MMSSVSELFRNLALPPAATDTLAAVPFPGHGSHRIAKNDKGQAIVLIGSVHDDTRLVALPIRTEHLSVLYSTEYRIQHASGAVTREMYSAITCLTSEPAFIRYFLNVVAGLLDSLGPQPATGEVVRVIRTVVELFRSLTLSSKTAVQGVWAELFLIAESRDKAVAANAWHASPQERYDFALGRERLDVKSSTIRERRHYFSHDQLTPPTGTSLWIASVFAERSSGGVSLEVIIDRACEDLSGSAAAHIRSVAAETLGSSFTNALDVAFDYELAVDSLRYFGSQTIPRLATPLPVDVSDVHYRSDLSRCPPVKTGATLSPLLDALPRTGEA